ncbi:hypothetical protein GCM10010124_34170 [Pilimelia terevasa]|uniref:Uncharacterized protein n=1 Tax=Pilimelia terevasa TaxID=53372 RepID=A0A8J3FKC1_9ACTN|nr:hypothetical protein [Pilimelia terevasa]GGK38508.1 hypothetical protein GCM10010124_34170 [Pilimelia terevasa]
MRYRRSHATISVFLVIWLLIGLLAAWQRGYLSRSNASCDRLGATALTIVAGPLNYVGANPAVKCVLPKPSQ